VRCAVTLRVLPTNLFSSTTGLLAIVSFDPFTDASS
jgi:hypothetical protein